MPKWNYEIRPAAGERLNSRDSLELGVRAVSPEDPGMERETAVTRCRDMIIERSKWVCSIAVMSALGVAIFGVAGASGRGSAWSAVHPAKAHTIVVHPHGSAHISSGGASHAYSSQVSRASVSHHVVSSGYSSPPRSYMRPRPPATRAPPTRSRPPPRRRPRLRTPRRRLTPATRRTCPMPVTPPVRTRSLVLTWPTARRFGRTATSPPRLTPTPPTAPPSAPSSAPGPARASRCRAPTPPTAPTARARPTRPAPRPLR